MGGLTRGNHLQVYFILLAFFVFSTIKVNAFTASYTTENLSLKKAESFDNWIDFNKNLNFGLTSQKDIWIKIEVEENEWGSYIELRNIFVNYAVFAKVNAKKISKIGKYEKNITYPNFKIPHQTKTLYFKLSGFGLFYIPIIYYDKKHYLEEAQKTKSFHFVLLVLFILFPIISYWVYATIKNKIYLYYFFYTLNNCFVFIFITGNIILLFPNINFEFRIKLLFLFISLVYTTITLLTIPVLELKNRIKKLNVYLSILIATIGLIGFALPIEFGIIYYNIIPIPFTIYFCLLVLTRFFKNQNKVLLYYMVGWLIFIIGSLSMNLMNLGILPYNFFTENLAAICCLIESSIFMMALFVKEKQTKNYFID